MPKKRTRPIPEVAHPREFLLSLYYTMRLTREVEDRASILYRQGRMTGGLYSGRGNEATAVGAAMSLEPRDWLLPLHRDIGASLARGTPLREMFLQLLCRAAGPTRGRDSGNHQTVLDRRLVGMVSHLGTMVPIAAGVALVSKLNRDGAVTLNFIGEGATSHGEFHEGLNIASVLKLPLVVVIDNNQWAYGTPKEREYACANLSDRAAGYGIPGVTVDGTDPLAVHAAVKAAADRARRGEGPSLVESVTFRMKGHSEADDAAYVPEAQKEAWAKRDPVTLFAAKLHAEGVLSPASKADLEQEIAEEVAKAADEALAAPPPSGDAVENGVFAP
jgi:TPP-dependent pyruvate/acetoin dehydrogenase alpha subunit